MDKMARIKQMQEKREERQSQTDTGLVRGKMLFLIHFSPRSFIFLLGDEM